jgi:hypothetical protein
VKKNKTKFRWKCPHCSHRNVAAYDFTFDIANVGHNCSHSHYTSKHDCNKCGTKCELQFFLSVKLLK